MPDITNLDTKSLIAYIEQNKLNDKELRTLKKVDNYTSELQEIVKLSKKKWVKHFLENSKNIKNEYNYILTAAYIKAKDKLKSKIKSELIERHIEGKIKDNTFFSFIEKNKLYEFLSLFNDNQLQSYKEFLHFEHLNHSEEFCHFYELQTSGLFNFSLAPLLHFSKSIELWDNYEDKIKECFCYFNPDVISLITDKCDKEKSTSLIDFYIKKHLKNPELLFLIEGAESEYGKEKIKEEFKTKMTFLCKDLGLHSLMLSLQKYDINFNIVDPKESSVKKKKF